MGVFALFSPCILADATCFLSGPLFRRQFAGLRESKAASSRRTPNGRSVLRPYKFKTQMQSGVPSTPLRAGEPPFGRLRASRTRKEFNERDEILAARAAGVNCESV
jgi:hypothetical protein